MADSLQTAAPRDRSRSDAAEVSGPTATSRRMVTESAPRVATADGRDAATHRPMF